MGGRKGWKGGMWKRGRCYGMNSHCMVRWVEFRADRLVVKYSTMDIV